MGFRFRRSIKIAPGLRVNVGKSGDVSLSAGVRGASVNFGSRGIYTNIGIPGSGLSYRQKVNNDSEQQRNIRAQQKLAQEYPGSNQQLTKSQINLIVDDTTGELLMKDADGQPLSKQNIKRVWDQKRNEILELMERKAVEINGDINLLTKIHEDTPSPHSVPKYNIVPFNEQPPEQPKQSAMLPKPEIKQLPPLGFFSRLFKCNREAHNNDQKRLHEKWERTLLTWEETRKKETEKYQIALQRYEGLRQAWEVRKKDHESEESNRKDKFPQLLRADTDLMNKSLEDALNLLSWPRETLVSYQITHHGQQIWLDVDLPEIENIPQKLASVASTGKKLNIKNKSQKQLQLEYAQHIHGIAFRLAGTAFATLPTARVVIISGFSQRLNSSAGNIKNEYLFSVKVGREKYSRIDFDSLDRVNPMEAMGEFEIRRKLTSTGVFKAIDPFEPKTYA